MGVEVVSVARLRLLALVSRLGNSNFLTREGDSMEFGFEFGIGIAFVFAFALAEWFVKTLEEEKEEEEEEQNEPNFPNKLALEPVSNTLEVETAGERERDGAGTGTGSDSIAPVRVVSLASFFKEDEDETVMRGDPAN